jgi:hypothetical protein
MVMIMDTEGMCFDPRLEVPWLAYLDTECN